MTLHFHPLAFGVMLVVAVGTLAYTYWNSGRQTEHPHGYGRSRHQNYDQSSRASSVYGDDERPSRRKRNSDRCTICLASLKSALKTLTCGHVFHNHCIMTWLIENKSCPICRTPV